MVIPKNRELRDEFRLNNFGFGFNLTGESKLMFVQSKISFITPKIIFMYRLVTSTYLLFAMIFNIINRNSTKWLLYMTSCNYVIAVIYFIHGLTLSCQAVFCKISFCRSEGSTIRNKTFTERQNGKNAKGNLRLATMNGRERNGRERNGTISNSSTTGSTTRLTEKTYSVDSIILDIEENCNKRQSIAPTNEDNGHHQLQHARLEENRLPSIQSDVFIEQKTMTPLYLKMYWFLSSVSLNLSFVVVGVYWIALFPNQDGTTVTRWYFRIDRHAIVLIFVILDHVIARTPIRIFHFIYPSVVFIIYCVFNGVYTKITESKPIYSMMDFEKKLTMSLASIALASFVTVPIIQFCLYWLIYRMKERVFGSSSIDR